MNRDDWIRVLDEINEMGTRAVQFVGGEATLHPALPELIDHALTHALDVEVFSNLVHVPDPLWTVFAQPGVSLATSYYSDDPAEHAAITGKPSHARTRANIAKAQARGIPLRAGLIDFGANQRTSQARAELVNLGVPSIGYDRVRELGRAAPDQQGSAPQLCGRCGDGIAAIDPNGEVRPCLFAKWISIGNVHDRPLAQIVSGMPAARAALIAAGMTSTPSDPCPPDGADCYPHNRLVPAGGPSSPESATTRRFPREDL